MRLGIDRSLLVVLLALGCGAGGPPSAGASSPASATADADGAVEEPSKPGDPVVTLLSPGEEPRAPLRYSITAGRRPTMLMDLALTITLGVGDAAQRTVASPPVRTTIGVEVLEVASSTGTARIRYTIERVDVLSRPTDPPELVEKVAKETGSTVGLKTEMSLTRRGFARDVTAAVPETASPAMRAYLENTRGMTEQIASIFPLEPVGLGAHWRVESKVKTSMFAADQVALVTLLQRDEERVALSVTVDQTAPDQMIHPPELPEGAAARLEGYVGHGSGRTEMPFDLRPPLGELTIRSNFVTKIVMGGQSMIISSGVEMIMKTSPSEAR